MTDTFAEDFFDAMTRPILPDPDEATLDTSLGVDYVPVTECVLGGDFCAPRVPR